MVLRAGPQNLEQAGPRSFAGFVERREVVGEVERCVLIHDGHL